MPARFAFIADDFGMSPEINAAVLECYKAGAIHGASLMMDQPATAEAVGLAKEHKIPVGVHLNFSDFRDTGARSKWRPFPWPRGLRATHMAARRKEFEEDFKRETRLQFDAFKATALPLAFVNGHHHLHVQPVVFEEVRHCLREFFNGFSGYIRLGRSHLIGLPQFVADVGAWIAMGGVADPGWNHDRTTDIWLPGRVFGMSARGVRRSLNHARTGFHEFVFHPGANKAGSSGASADAGQNREGERLALLDMAPRPSP